MDKDEAAQDAVEQFESQGVDLSNIVKTAGGANSGPVPALLAQLEETTDIAEAVQCLQQLSEAVKESEENYLISAANDASGEYKTK